MDTSLSLYRSMFVGLLNTESSSIIENNSPAHAKVILQELVKCAKETVHIFCTHFSKEVYGDADLQTAIKDAVSRGVSVNIAVRDDSPETADFFEQLKKEEKCHLYQGIHEKEGKKVYPSDFCVVDGKRYRLERDQEKGTAFVCANDTDVAGRLVAWFGVSVKVAA